MFDFVPDSLWDVELEDKPGIYGRALWFLHRLPEACGPALWVGYVTEGYLPGDLTLTFSPRSSLTIASYARTQNSRTIFPSERTSYSS